MTNRVVAGRKRVRDYFIYIGIGIALVGFLIWSAGVDVSESTIKWIGLAVETPILFGYAVADYRRSWKRPSFWLVIVGLLAVHLIGFAVVLAHVRSWGPLLFVACFPVENVGIDAALVASGHFADKELQ
jgi:hypothetical protein